MSLPVPLAPDAPLPLLLDDERLDTPAVLVDLDIADDNIRRFARYAERAGVVLRPHAKSHKSPAMAARQVAAGAVGLCAATASEAAALVATGTTDVTVAYPLVGTRKLDRLLPALADARVTLTSDSDVVTEGYGRLAARAGRPLEVLVEVDTGMHRAGVPAAVVLDLARGIERTPGLEFAGILTHAGHAHDVDGPGGLAEVARSEAAVMGGLRADLEAAGLPPRVVSAGSTLTAPYLDSGDGITELRPGTYVYNDLRTLACWACTPDSLAASVLTTVVSRSGGRVTVDAGSKTLTTTQDPQVGQGHVLGAPQVRVARLSEEHGVLAVPDGGPSYAVGDRLRLLPVHVCVWMDLQPEVYGTRGGQVVERLDVAAMRHSL